MAAIGNKSIPGLPRALYNHVLEFLPPEEILAKAPLVSRGWNELRDQRVRDAARRCLRFPLEVLLILDNHSISLAKLPFLPIESPSECPDHPGFSRFERITAPIMKWRFGSRAGIVLSIRSKELAGQRRGSISFHKNSVDGQEITVRSHETERGSASSVSFQINSEQLTQLLDWKHPEYEINCVVRTCYVAPEHVGVAALRKF